MSDYIINTDNHFCIGNTHKVCEDYAISGFTPKAYVILSDGCSSAKFTDIGARILCRLAEKILIKNNYDFEHFSVNIIKEAATAIKFLELPICSLYATLGIAYEENNTVKVIFFGDGNIITVNKDNKHITLYSISFNTNAPDYLAYNLDEQSKEAYLASSTKKRIVVKNGEFSQYECELFKPVIMEFSLLNYETVAIASDGLSSFMPNDKLSEIEIIKKFILFKNFNGEYVKRRSIKAIKELEKEGLIHFDDISIGAIHSEYSGV